MCERWSQLMGECCGACPEAVEDDTEESEGAHG